MSRNRTAQLIVQSAFCALGAIAVLASLGLFDYRFSETFYVYFTNISNYLCIGIMLAELIQTARKKTDGFVTVSPLLKFIGVLAILLTFLVFNLLLAGEEGRDPALNFKVSSILLHVVLPILYIADWFLFYEHRKIKWFYPLLTAIFPIVYVVFIFVRAAFLHFDPAAPVLYPYFFLDLGALGVGGVAKWIAILLVAFMAVGYLFFGLDRLLPAPKAPQTAAAEAPAKAEKEKNAVH